VPFLRRLWDLLRPPRDEHSEHGGVAAIVAVLMANAIIFGMGAVVIDIGRLYLEREQLQSGADAASMAVALSCAKGATCTQAAQLATAQKYAQINTNDLKANVQICVNGTGCPVWQTTAKCPALPPVPAGAGAGSYVEVRTSTLTSTGGTLIPPVFGRALIPGYQGNKVGACARVHWGPPFLQKVLALGISLCDFNRMTSNNTVFYGPVGTLLNATGLFNLIGLPNPTANKDSAIPVSAPLSVAGLPLPSCTTPTIDLTVPRGYSWLVYADLSPPDADCMMNLKVGDKPKSFLLAGLYVGMTCIQRLQSLRGKSPIMVPIYDKIEAELLTLAPQYRIAGFAPFVVTGYTDLLAGVGSAVGSILNGGLLPGVAAVLCGLSSCIYGYFTKTLVPQHSPVFGTGPNYGATVIARTG
jgi:hypothetical protein